MRYVKLLAGTSLLWTGCFYIDPINRPAKITDIVRVDSTGNDIEPFGESELHHGDPVRLRAEFHDLDGNAEDAVITWSADACDAMAKMCSPLGVTQVDGMASFVVPTSLPADAAMRVQTVVIDLQVFDDRGAIAVRNDTHRVDEGPTLAVSSSARTFTVGAPITLLATYGDPDAGVPQPGDNMVPTVQLQWKVFSPDAQPSFTLSDFTPAQNPADPAHQIAGEVLVPAEAGDWTVRVIASNAVSKTNEKEMRFTVQPDRPPCIAQLQPIAPPAGTSLPITEPTRFSVPVVTDDLDPYPQLAGEPLFGSATFEWSILPPGATERQPLVGATGNSIDFDPGAFKPGDRVELRVEVSDRNRFPVACPDDQPLCMSDPRPACSQRQTWLVEVR